jgi:hypothetical protein
MRELPFEEDSVDAFDAVDVTLFSDRSFEGPLLWERTSGFGLAGDIEAIAELGRSGKFRAVLLARLCSAISSFSVDRPPGRGAAALGTELVLALPPCSAALGLFASFSSSALDFGSSLSMMAFALSVHTLANVQ